MPVSFLSKHHALCALALAAATTAAHAANTYSFRVFALGVTSDIAAPATPAVPPAPAHNYATLRTGTASLSLSTDNLTVTHNGYQGAGNVRADVGLSSGKWYWEVRRHAGLGAVAIGIGPSSALTGTGWGAAPTPVYAVAYQQSYGWTDGRPNVKGLSMPTSDNDVLGFALDMDSGTFRLFNNCVEYAVWSGKAGTQYPIVGSGGGAAGGKATANFGASPFTCPVPAGFNAGVWAP